MAEDSLPTAEEYALFREAYAETYPVRPLLNAIDAKDAEIAEQAETIERLQSANHEGGVLAGEVIQENLRLRAAISAAIERLECTNADTDHYCPNCDNSLWPVRKGLLDARDAAAEPKPIPTESAKGATAVESIPAPPGYRG